MAKEHLARRESFALQTTSFRQEFLTNDRRHGNVLGKRRLMRTTIELPESVYRKAEKVARTREVTIEEFIIQAFERELKGA